MESAKKKSPMSVQEEVPEDKSHIRRTPKLAATCVDKISNNEPTSLIKVKKVDFPFDYGPFDDEWVLNYKFDDSIVQRPTNSVPKREDDMSTIYVDAMSPVSVESLNTLIGWANHNPHEDEQSTDSDNLTDWDNIY
ncbi:hypothetical protein R6Q59_021657 [Mikania micrantha]